ncbi:diaminopimelate epimerase [Azospirillum agricola]|uniref:diaminopimelate epimerase n=1 Tax=Azospirillum agricola TaxID=1720247 RepID=UPI000A0F0DFF|nr:diaminopimelate epimerase [Azospirillum agricola]SMH39470.1 diaminopimelate epimerase [Azospirillum lipoferum]
MSIDIEFTKMHGLGNDFIVVEERALDGLDGLEPGALARRICHRQTGVGADGLLLLVGPDADHTVGMRVLNPDGSESSMCGNGIRCVARYVHDRAILRRPVLAVRTRAGLMTVAVERDGDTVTGLRIDMGLPRFDAAGIPVRAGADPAALLAGGNGSNEPPLRFHAVGLGVPHAVTFVDALDGTLVRNAGPRVERDPLFPEGVNVNFVQPLARDRLRVRSWERGAGATLACASGACAAAVVAGLRGLTGPRVTVELELGELTVERHADGRVFMTGPAEQVCTGRFHVR